MLEKVANIVVSDLDQVLLQSSIELVQPKALIIDNAILCILIMKDCLFQ